MIYVKAAAVGIVSGLLLAVVWVLGALWLPIYWQMLLSYVRNEGGGVGGSVISSDSALFVALVGFTAGFYLTVRRARRRPMLPS